MNRNFYAYLFAGTLILCILTRMIGEVAEYKMKANRPSYSKLYPGLK